MRPAAQDWSWRYTRDTQQAEFLEALWNSSLERHREIDEGSLIWRAHIGNHWQPEQVGDTEEEFPCPFSPERMKPLHDPIYGRPSQCEGNTSSVLINCQRDGDRGGTAMARRLRVGWPVQGCAQANGRELYRE